MAQFTTTYPGLIALMSVYVDDSSTEYSSNVQGFVNRAEERVLRDIDVSLFNTSAQTTTTSGTQTISKSNSESPVRNIYMSVQNYHLLRRTRAYIESHGGTGPPLYYYDDQSLIYFAPTPDSTYTIKINQMVRPLPLTPSNTSNWISQYVADLLLWAALIESEKFLIAPDRIQDFEQSYASVLGPIRANWRDLAQNTYDVEKPTPQPVQDR